MSDDTTIDGVAELTKDELLALVVGDREAWLALIAEAGDRIDEPGAAGEWTLRDVVNHITGYHRFLVVNLGGTARDFDAMPEEIGGDVQKRNEWMHEADRERSWDLVSDEAADVHRELVAQLEARSPEQIKAPMVEWQPWPVWRWVIDLTEGHRHEHLPDLRAWLDGESATAG